MGETEDAGAGDDNPWLTTRDIAELLGVAEVTVRSHHRRGTMPPADDPELDRPPGHRVLRWRTSTIGPWLDARRRPGRPGGPTHAVSPAEAAVYRLLAQAPDGRWMSNRDIAANLAGVPRLSPRAVGEATTRLSGVGVLRRRVEHPRYRYRLADEAALAPDAAAYLRRLREAAGGG